MIQIYCDLLLGDNATRVCTMLDKQCLYSVNHAMIGNHTLSKCDCKQDCTSIGYDVEILQRQIPRSYYATPLAKWLNGSP